jgi:hypothetical protein
MWGAHEVPDRTERWWGRMDWSHRAGPVVTQQSPVSSNRAEEACSKEETRQSSNDEPFTVVAKNPIRSTA